MSLLERRAWLALWSMCPPYAVYFAVQTVLPGRSGTMWERIGWLAAAAAIHLTVFAAGSLWFRAREGRGDGVFTDERDLAIEARACRSAYQLLLFGAVGAGMMLPFKAAGWQIVNASLMFIVLAEMLRNGLIVHGYRGGAQLAR
ncbi:MAG TPA: hypothetical protein VG248_03820 [Caulobacteraceae bacterium]|jgi:uncharacterized membrane protein|nr:hypothetical protein [Caulobacteraceae bacterium]